MMLAEVIPYVGVTVYALDALVLLALADRRVDATPLSRGFLALATTGFVGAIVGAPDAQPGIIAHAANHAIAPAACAWAVLETCRPRGGRVLPIALAALATFVVAYLLPRDEHLVTFVDATVPAWQRTTGLYWLVVWGGWSAVAAFAVARKDLGPTSALHVMATLVAASVPVGAIGLVAWAMQPIGYTITQITDLAFSVGIGIIAARALWTAQPRS